MALSRQQDYYLAAGLQASFNNSNINYLRATTESQFHDGAYDPLAATGENFGGQSISYIDANMGIMWYHIKNIRNYQFVGGSAFHLNRPDFSFIQSSGDPARKLYAKYVLHFGAGFTVGPRFDIVPYLLAMNQGPSFEVTGGAFAKFILDERKTSAYGGTAYYIGPFVRVVGDEKTNVGADAIIIASKIDFDAVTFGLSYDINVSTLSPATTGRGGPEISIQYIGAFKGKRTKTFCPKF
jgi:hypothetical protein